MAVRNRSPGSCIVRCWFDEDPALNELYEELGRYWAPIPPQRKGSKNLKETDVESGEDAEPPKGADVKAASPQVAGEGEGPVQRSPQKSQKAESAPLVPKQARTPKKARKGDTMDEEMEWMDPYLAYTLGGTFAGSAASPISSPTCPKFAVEKVDSLASIDDQLKQLELLAIIAFL